MHAAALEYDMEAVFSVHIDRTMELHANGKLLLTAQVSHVK